MADPPQISGAEHHWIDIGGFRVHYAEAGDPSSPPLLLLHGWPQHHGMWAPIIERLRDRFHILAPDLRGFGWTGSPGSGYDGETFARDQVALLDRLGIEDAFVLGHDWGGWTTMVLGFEHPERVRRLIVCDSPPPWPADDPWLFRHVWRSWYAALNALPGLGPRAVPYTARTILSRGNAGTPFSPAEIEAYADSFRPPARRLAVSALYRYYFRSFARAFRGRWDEMRLTIPTLVIFGERDLWVTPDGLRPEHEYERHADDLRVELVPDSGHFVVDEKPDLIAARALSEFGAAED